MLLLKAWNMPKNFIFRSLSNVDRKSTRLNSSHTVIYTLSLHDALPICQQLICCIIIRFTRFHAAFEGMEHAEELHLPQFVQCRSEEHTSELQSHSDLHSFPTRRSSDLPAAHLLYNHSFYPFPCCF